MEDTHDRKTGDRLHTFLLLIVSRLPKKQVALFQNSNAAVHYRDEEWHKETTEKVSKYYHGFQRNDHESLSIYLQRLGTNHRLKNDDSTRYEIAKEKILLPLAQLALRSEKVLIKELAKTLTRGYCHCTDVVALSNDNISGRLSLANFQTSGRVKCTRCWFIAECVGKFAGRWPSIDPADIKIWMGPLHIMHMKDILWGRGSARVFRVQWLEPSNGHLDAIYHLAQKLVLEIYHDLDGFPLYPNMTYRQTRPNIPTAQKCTATIKSWTDQCMMKHTFCNEARNNNFLPNRLVDVGCSRDHSEMRLVKNTDIMDKSAKYVALSYCWGEKEQRKKPIPKTKQATIQDRLTNIPWIELTQTFQDAIDITLELNLRYLWIDALCIIQDNKHDFANEASQMASIYGEAYVVLAATHAPTGDSGLLHQRPESYRISRTDSDGRTKSVRVKEETEHADFTTGEPQNFTSTPLFARAWCFQERLLARRVVHFAKDELVFECREKLWCECDLIIPEHPLYANFKVRLSYSLCKELAAARIRAWYSILRPYTARSLSYESDRFPALSGIARIIATPEMGSYCAGLWSCELPSALLWRVLRPLPEKNGLVTRPSKYRAPTWSWAGVQAVIEGHVVIHESIEPVARVIEVQCLPSTSDPYGEVASGYIVLETPAIDVILQKVTTTASPIDRMAHVYREENENDRITCETDVYLGDELLPLLAVSIEQRLTGVSNCCISCLLLHPVDNGNVFHRVGIVDCSARWFDDCANRTVVKII